MCLSLLLIEFIKRKTSKRTWLSGRRAERGMHSNPAITVQSAYIVSDLQLPSNVCVCVCGPLSSNYSRVYDTWQHLVSADPWPWNWHKRTTPGTARRLCWPHCNTHATLYRVTDVRMCQGRTNCTSLEKLSMTVAYNTCLKSALVPVNHNFHIFHC